MPLSKCKPWSYGRFAEVSYEDVRSLAASGTSRYTLLCHCCQQCIEKYFKHVATMKGESTESVVLKTHDLNSLASFVGYPGAECYSDVLHILGASYSDTGYPNADETAVPLEPTADFMKAAVELVDSVHDWVLGLIREAE